MCSILPLFYQNELYLSQEMWLFRPLVAGMKNTKLFYQISFYSKEKLNKNYHFIGWWCFQFNNL